MNSTKVQSIDPGTSFNIHIRGLRLHAKRHGNPDSPNKILAIHGWLDNHQSFEPLAQYFNDYDFVAIDLPGHGLSDHRAPYQSYAFQEYIFDVDDILNSLQWTNVNLLAHSMGAAIAIMYCCAKPKTIKNLICFDSIGPLSEPAHKLPQRLENALKGYHKSQNTSVKSYSSLDQAVIARCSKSDISTTHAKMIMAVNLIQQSVDQFDWRFDKRLLAPSATYLTEEQVRHCIMVAKSHTNIALFIGDQSIYKNDIMARADAAEIDYQLLSGGHYIHMEQTELIVQKILQTI